MDKLIFERLDELNSILLSRCQLPKMVILWLGLTTVFFYPLEDPYFNDTEDVINEVSYLAGKHASYVGCVFFDIQTRFKVDGFPATIAKSKKDVRG